MTENVVIIPTEFLRCAGPNCGVQKGSSDRWWVMWSSVGEYDIPQMHLAPWGRTPGGAGRHNPCLRGGLCAKTAIAVYGKHFAEAGSASGKIV
jgi:hypothetical protein